MNFIEKIKSHGLYYKSMKVTLVFFIIGVFSFFIAWVGIWTEIDVIRAGGVVLGALSLVLAFLAYFSMMFYMAIFFIKKIFCYYK